MKNKILHFVTALILISIPALHMAQTPNLGAAAPFVLFTTDGAVGNTQRSNITGEVGTNVGAITGFGNVDGKIHMTPDAYTIAAANALTSLNTELNLKTSTGTHAPDIGVETINPGVYDINGSAVLNGILTLNGQGDPNALFIFRVTGTFAITIGSGVILTNGAAACNVFWKVGGTCSLYGGNMKGTVIGGAAINMYSGLNLEGRALTTVGAINVSQNIAYLPLGCGTPVLNGPPAPNLLSTKNFGLFTASGAMSNAGTSKITGDVGSNTNNPSGFNASDVSGTIYPSPNTITAQASSDLTLVYNDLNGRIEDIELSLPDDLGYNLVLTPHTYLLNAATVLHDTLFLNAQGNANAVFILKVTGAFSTGVKANVMLINGAQAKNVYWKIDGAVDIAVNSKIAGTMVVADGAIALQTDVVLAGRGLTMVGAVSTSTSRTTMNPDGTLPVTWLSFTGKPVGETVLLEWGTANELNNGFFTIQKSRDGNFFETLTKASAHGEIKNSEYYYSFVDKLPYSNNYYKISQTDKDGLTSFYKTIMVKINVKDGFTAYHYVQQNYVFVKASGPAQGLGSIKLVSLDGKLVSSQTILLTKETSTYKVDKPVPKGIYLLQLESKGTILYNKKIIVL